MHTSAHVPPFVLGKCRQQLSFEKFEEIASFLVSQASHEPSLEGVLSDSNDIMFSLDPTS
jgi:hypothetical protein